MAIKRDTPRITIQNQKLKEEFLNTIESIFKQNSDVPTYLKEIGGKSTTTFNHSVNVAFHVFEMLKKDKNFSFTKDEIERWTEAALVHDTGKLATKNEILHATEKLSDDDMSTMMRHSIEGFYVAKNRHGYHFSKEGIAAIIGHHIDAKYLEGGPEKGFEGASKSRKQWEYEFEKGEIEGLLVENCSWMTEKDVYALEMISFCDVVEALRSNDRSYQLQHNWEISDFTTDKFGRSHGWSIVKIVQDFNITPECLSKKFDGIVLDKSYQKQFDRMQEMGMPWDVRSMVTTYARDVKVRVSKDTSEEIEKNPQLGEMFVEKQRSKQNGAEYFVVKGETKNIVFGKISVPNLEAGPIQDQNVVAEFSEGFDMVD